MESSTTNAAKGILLLRGQSYPDRTIANEAIANKDGVYKPGYLGYSWLAVGQTLLVFRGLSAGDIGAIRIR